MVLMAPPTSHPPGECHPRMNFLEGEGQRVQGLEFRAQGEALGARDVGSFHDMVPVGKRTAASRAPGKEQRSTSRLEGLLPEGL